MPKPAPKHTPPPSAKALGAAPLNGSSSLAQELESLLDGFAHQHRALLKHVTAQREALRKADGVQVQAAADDQSRVLASLATLEQRRRELVALACSRYSAL